ncbi:MAG: UPF0182 family protein [Micropruina sp.]|nr:UPF0182 family protein [Micropruina sp.]
MMRRSPLLPTVIVAAFVLVAYLVFTQIWTDKLWFDSLNYSSVFSIQLFAQVGLFILFFLVMGGLVSGNLLLAHRVRPVIRRSSVSVLLERYREVIDTNLAAVVLTPGVVLGLLAGMSTGPDVMPVLAWWNRAPFGVVDPKFGLDVGFYVFEYPVWRIAISFLLSALFFSIMAAGAMYFALGALIPARVRGLPSVAPGARIHLSILAGITLIVYGLQSLLDQYSFLLEQGTLFTGLHFTDDGARVGARLIVGVIAFVVAALFFANAMWPRLIVPVVGLVLMVVSSLIVSVLYPAIIQSFVVRPNEPDRESPFVAAHIDMTRQAYNVDDTLVEEYAAVTQVRAGQLKADAEALPGIRLMDPSVIPPTFEQLQQVRGYYSFPAALDVDRYILGGVETDVVVAARELNLAGLPDQNWNNIHTVYTHGYGLVMAYGNRRQGSGEPEWIVRDIPPTGQLGDHESRIYFGEESTNFAVVGRPEGQAPIELDTPGGGEGGRERTNVYTGKGGVPIGDMFTRALYATRFMDVNLVLSDRVNSASKLLYDRTPKERVQQVAPWLTVDSNVYPAIVDGRAVWIVDAYTTSHTYPNSQLVSLRSATADTQSRVLGSQVDTNINYIRNSVKAVVDAYDGTVDLFAWDESDPILQAYSRAFPDTLKPRSAITPDLLSHLRYPEDLFKVQREILGRYHMTNPNTWYAQSDLWTVPNDPVKTSAEAKEPPYYLSIKWPGDAAPVFSQTTVFVPRGRSNLASYLSVVAEATSPDYGKLRVLKMSDSQQIDGPGQTFNAINSDPKVAEMLRPFLNQGSSAATYGNLLTLPMGNGLLYVAPVYTMRQLTNGSYPALRFVVVRFGEYVGIGETLQEALDSVFDGNAGAETGENEPTGTPSPSVQPTPGSTPSAPSTTSPADQQAAVAQLQKAEAAFTAAEAALRKGDLAEYQRKTDEARVALAAALKAMGR